MPGKNTAGKPALYGGGKNRGPTLKEQQPVFRAFLAQREKDEILAKRKKK